jgi:hypothetical protein
MYTCNPADWEVEVGGLWSEASPSKSLRPIWKTN